jgi:hypothetical protein
MDRRIDSRYPASLQVTVTDIAAPDRVASGLLVDISESGVCATLSLALAESAIVKAQVGDCVLFGHVTYCDVSNSHEEQSFRTGIEVVRVLIGESDLARLMKAILAETMPATPGVRDPLPGRGSLNRHA